MTGTTTSLPRSGSKRRTISTGLLALTGFLVLGATAVRADCTEDVNALMKKRMAAIEAVNKSAKTTGNKLDPIAACPRLRSLASVEGEAAAYLKKNQEWCGLPSDFVEKMSASYGRTSGFAQKACSVAVQIKKNQQMQAQQQQQQQAEAPKLPSGPL